MKILSLLISLFVFTSFSPVVSPEKPSFEEIEWISFEEAIERNKKEPKKIFIDVYTDWCGWCKRMDQTTFKNEVISKLVSEHYYAVKLDAEQKEAIEFDGNTFKFVANGRRGYHELAAALLQNKLSFPTVVFLDEQMRMIQPIPGYQQPQSLAPILQYIGEDHFKKTSWEDFQKTYKSQF